jgi:replicative DNA helicase
MLCRKKKKERSGSAQASAVRRYRVSYPRIGRCALVILPALKAATRRLLIAKGHVLMSLVEEQPALPESIYTVPDVEWRVLLSLAAAAHPGEVITAGGWYEALFASEHARTSFQELAGSSVSLSLQVPISVDGVAAFADPAALQAARQTLVAFAQFRHLETVQGNLAREVRRLAAARRVEGVGTLLEAARTALRTVETLDGQAAMAQTQTATLGELAASYWDRIAEQRNAAPTGLGSLDAALGGGLQTKRLFVVLGGPGSGKTTLVNQIAEKVAESGRPVVYLTTEDPMSTLLAKTLARLGRIDYGAVLQGRGSEQVAINKALLDVSERRSAERLLYVEGNGAVLDELSRVAQRHFARFADEQQGGGPGVLVVDYLQRMARAQMKAMRSNVRDLREAVTILTEDLRDLARDLNCSVIAIASQNRASGYGNTSAMTSAKESGDIEYTADVLMSLAKDEQRQAPLRCEARSLSLAKNRLGSQTTIPLDWRADRQQFTEALSS